MRIAVCAIAVAIMAVAFPIGAAALPTPIPQTSQTPPPDTAAPSATPLPLMVTGQVIDIERGFIVFTTGDALRVSDKATFLDAASGSPVATMPAPGIYALATIDTVSGTITSVRFSRTPIAQGTPVAEVPRRYIVQISPTQTNPELAPPKSAYTARLTHDTLARITVEVPPNTPFVDDVFMTTDTSGWNPQAVKMQRQDATHFFIEMRLRTGSEFHFLFTRGSWSKAERDRNGLERDARDLYVEGSDLLRVEATVYRWADLP
jgi:hypothetical protein